MRGVTATVGLLVVAILSSGPVPLDPGGSLTGCPSCLLAPTSPRAHPDGHRGPQPSGHPGCGCDGHGSDSHLASGCSSCGIAALAWSPELPQAASHFVSLPIRHLSPRDGRVLPWRPPA